MCEPSSHKSNSQQSQPESSVQQTNSGSMDGGQEAAIGDGNVQVQGNANSINSTLFFGQQARTNGVGITRQEYRNRQALLTKVKNFWVKGVLEKSLYKQALIELGLEEKPDAISFAGAEAIANPGNAILEIGDNSPQPLPEGTKVIDIFDKIGAGRTLLILGEPGSGKTTTLLELVRDLIARAEQDVNLLIPVVFNLSSWASKRQKIADWLVEELKSKYDVPKKIGQSWVTQQQLLPLLDGLDEVKADYQDDLDEVKADYQDDCIVALNQFKEGYEAQLVVCSRIKDYEALSNRLNFQSAVDLRLLTLEQVCHYLDRMGNDLVGLRALIEEDRVLQELAQSPLMLNMMTLAYEGVALEDLPRFEVLEERRNRLFDDYIERMFHRRNYSSSEPRYSKKQTKHWLLGLAQNMVQESQTVFLIENIQPYWLKNTKQKQTYQLILGLIEALILGLIAGLIVGVSTRLNGENLGLVSSAGLIIIGLVVGLIMGLIAGLTAGLRSGGEACIQHFTLRLILYRNNYIPWNYARFLDYTTERIFLQKVGSGYIFIHRMLMEHFAQMLPES